MNSINLHIYPSPFRFESRILRETKAIIDFELSEQIIIASGWANGMSEIEQIDEKRSVRRFKLFSDRFKKNLFINILKYLEFIFKVFFYYKHENIKVINCHSLFVLPIGYLLKLFDSRIWLIYDAHELETQKTGLNKISKIISSVLEKKLIQKVDKLIVVSPSIGKWYKNKYGISNIVVIRNVSEVSNITGKNSVFNKKFSIPKESMIFIYQGGVSKGRGIELLLNVFSNINSNKHLVIMGFGNLVNLVKEAEKNNFNIHFHEAVKPSDIFYYTSGADVGLSIIENVSLSYYYCLPNKLFEYLHSGLPVIVSDFPDMSDVIKKFHCGWITGVSEKELIDILNSICNDEVLKQRQGILKVQKEINWEKESVLLFDAFPFFDKVQN